MHVDTFGSPGNSPVLLLHGGGVAGWMWDSLRRDLEAEHHVLIPDLPGHGASSSEPYLSHGRTVEALGEVLAGTVQGPVAVVGFSLGAQLAIQLASSRAELVDRALVVSAQAKAMPFTQLTLQALALASPLARRSSPRTLRSAGVDRAVHPHQRGHLPIELGGFRQGQSAL